MLDEDGEGAMEECDVVLAVAAGGDGFRDVVESHFTARELAPAGDGVESEADEQRFDGNAAELTGRKVRLRVSPRRVGVDERVRGDARRIHLPRLRVVERNPFE